MTAPRPGQPGDAFGVHPGSQAPAVQEQQRVAAAGLHDADVGAVYVDVPPGGGAQAWCLGPVGRAARLPVRQRLVLVRQLPAPRRSTRWPSSFSSSASRSDQFSTTSAAATSASSRVRIGSSSSSRSRTETSSSGARAPGVLVVEQGRPAAGRRARRPQPCEVELGVLLGVLRLDVVQGHAGLDRPAALLLDVELVGQRREERVLPALDQLADRRRSARARCRGRRRPAAAGRPAAPARRPAAGRRAGRPTRRCGRHRASHGTRCRH